MGESRRLVVVGLVIALCGLGACASLPEDAIGKPEVELRDVQVLGLGFKSQTFLLSFDISNPNPFPLPVNHVSYGVRLGGHRFASGETPSDFAVPASGDAQFAISVELDLLTTAPQLLTLMHDGVRDDIPYELEGRLGLDIPMIPSLAYRTDGAIQFNTAAYLSRR